MTPEVKDRLAELGVTDDKLQHVRDAPSQEEGEKRLVELKALAKKGFKRLALELHPDHTDNDPEKTQRFKRLKSVHESFQQAKFKGWRKPKVNGRRVAGHDDFDMMDAYFDLMYPNDPLMANFRKMKYRAQRQREQEVIHDELSELLRRAWKRTPPKRARKRAPKVKRQIQPLAERKGLWFMHEGKWLIRQKRRNER